MFKYVEIWICSFVYAWNSDYHFIFCSMYLKKNKFSELLTLTWYSNRKQEHRTLCSFAVNFRETSDFYQSEKILFFLISPSFLLYLYFSFWWKCSVGLETISRNMWTTGPIHGLCNVMPLRLLISSALGLSLQWTDFHQDNPTGLMGHLGICICK